MMSENVARWLANGRLGASSQTLAAATLGAVRASGPPDVPHDADDFGRCYRLCAVAPETSEGLKRLADVSNQWARLAVEWDALTKLYEDGRFKECSEIIHRCENPQRLRSYQIRTGDDGRFDVFPSKL